MAYCPQCGTASSDRFCPNCGAAMPTQGAAPPPPPGAPAAGAQAGGLTDNVAGALCYILGLLTGILFLILAPYNQNPRVKFHAWQSILFNVAWIAIWIVLGIVSTVMSVFALILIPIYGLLGLGAFILWLFLMWKAYNNVLWEIPIIGPFAKQQSGL